MKLKFIIISILILCSGCALSPVTESFGVIEVSNIQTEYLGEGNGYDIKYYIHFTPNTKEYTLYYYKLISNEWELIGSVDGDVPKLHNAKYSIGVPEDFILYNVNRQIKIEVRAYKEDKYSTFTPVSRLEYIFDFDTILKSN